ncbi:MAG: hydrogenase maturation nickel metallochaperone HypA [Polyangiaceae bacterium]|nr:hydrogenase maturation nickel metallochaperone HypA [Polyangiaceae bacterium]
MHEASLARQIISVVLERAARERAVRVTAVRGWVAESEALSPRSLEMHFAGHAAGTPAEGARLELRIIHIEGRCRECGAQFPADHHLLLCPACNATEVDLLGTPGLGIDDIEVT